MSDSPESPRAHGSQYDSETSSGFRHWWKKSDKGSSEQNVTFVEQDPTTRQKKSRISRLLKSGSGVSSPVDREGDGNGESSAATAKKRRQQVYQAQKRHRNRKAEYVQNLEAEVARLQHLDSVIHSEKNSLAHQNKAIKEFLAKQSIDTHLDSISLSSYEPSLSALGNAMVDIRYDPELGQDRVFLDMPDGSDTGWNSSDIGWNSSDTSPDEIRPHPVRHTPVTGDSWAALDFILALEWPCSPHIRHQGINPAAVIPEACSVGQFHGHALTTTQAVFSSATAPAQKDGKWQLPHSEIDKLVGLSVMLELDEELITPAQMYSAIRETIPNDDYLRPTLEALKKPLSSLVQCQSFGSCLDTAMFWEHFDGALQTIKLTRPELGG